MASHQRADPLLQDNQTETQLMRYFDVVSVDALSVLTKYLSHEPHSALWLHKISANDAQTVLQVGGALSAISRKMFKSLRGDDFNCFRSLCSNKSILLMNLMASHLEYLNGRESDLRRLNYERFCSLRVLCLYTCDDESAVERILAASGKSLLELEVRGRCMKKRMVGAIARHCKSLNAICVDFFNYPTSLKPIWSATGNTLIELRGDLPRREFIHIASYCKRVEKLNLWIENETKFVAIGDALIELLDALKSLQILDTNGRSKMYYSFTADNIRSLLKVCPSDVHVYTTIFVDHCDAFADYIRAVGTSLRRIAVYCQVGTLPREVIHAFVNVEELSLNLGPNAFTVVKSIFVDPMPNLRELSIRNLKNVKNSKLFSVLARSVSNLREFSCHFLGSSHDEEKRVPMKSSDFIKFLQANKHLSGFYLNYGSSYDSLAVREDITDFIPCLKVCKYLSDVVITYFDAEAVNTRVWYEVIGNACVPLRTKSLTLTVNFVRYLPSLYNTPS